MPIDSNGFVAGTKWLYSLHAGGQWSAEYGVLVTTDVQHCFTTVLGRRLRLAPRTTVKVLSRGIDLPACYLSSHPSTT